MNTFKVGATLEGVSTLKDGGVSLRYHTQELSAEDKMLAFGFQSSFGWLLFQEQDYKNDEVELEQIRKDTGGKSPSQRMRNVLYRLYIQSSKSITFEVYYGQQMERLLDLLKERLDK